MIFSLLDTPAYGGAEEYLLSVLFYLHESGYPVTLATNNSQVKEKCEGRINVIDLPYRLDAIGNWKGLVKYFLTVPGSVLWLIKTIHLFQSPVICIFPGFSDRLSFSPFVKLLGCSLIWLEYGPLEPTFLRNHGFPKILYALGKPFPDKIVTISQWTKYSLMKTGHIPEKKIQVIYPGVRSSAQHVESGTQKKKTFTVTTIARMAKEKEIDVLLHAWAKADLESAKLLIVGDGPEIKTYKDLAINLHLNSSVEFQGFVSSNEKIKILLRSDLFVFPSAWELEGFGMTTIEAMSTGLPILTTGYGPQSEIVIPGENGWYFRSHDSDDLAVKLKEAYYSRILTVFGKASKKIAEEKFSEIKMLRAWKKIISHFSS